MSTTLLARPTSAGDITTLNIKLLLTRAGWTGSDLARALRINQTQISNRMTGKTEWKISDLESIATLFNTTPWALMTPAPGDEWRPRQDSGLQPRD